MRPVPMFAQTLERDLFVRTTGPATAPTIVYVHGLGESGRCFDRFVREPDLAPYRHVIPDLPGYGRSPWPARVQDLTALADRLAAWLPTPAIVVGHSMGGVLGVLLAERHPTLVRALVNIEGNVSIGDCVFSGQAAALTVAQMIDGGLDAIADRVFDDGATRPALRGYHASLRFADPRTFHQHALDLVAASTAETMAARIAALPMPHAYVAGVPDGIAPRSHELLAAHGVAVDRIGPAGHWPFIDQPAATAAVVARTAARG